MTTVFEYSQILTIQETSNNFSHILSSTAELPVQVTWARNHFLNRKSTRDEPSYEDDFSHPIDPCTIWFSGRLWSILSHPPAWKQLEEVDSDHQSLLNLTKIGKLWKTRFIWWNCFSGQPGHLQIQNFAADAATLMDRDAGRDSGVTRRAYIFKIAMP